MPRPAVFFDRDDTLIRNLPYLRDPAQVQLLPGAAEAVQLAHTSGYVIVVVSNQSGVARGLISEADVEAVNARMAELLGAEGAPIDGIFYCPHHPTEGSDPRTTRWCDCRKPEPGLLLTAASQLSIDLEESVLIGDSGADLEAAERAGAVGLLVASPRNRALAETTTRYASPLAAVRAFLADRQSAAPEEWS